MPRSLTVAARYRSLTARGSDPSRVLSGSGNCKRSRLMSRPLAFFITFTTYGAWLHGDDAGSVDRDHNEPDTPLLPADPRRASQEGAAAGSRPLNMKS